MFLFGCPCKCPKRDLDDNNLHNRLKNSRKRMGSYIIRVVRSKPERRNPKLTGAEGRPSCRRGPSRSRPTWTRLTCLTFVDIVRNRSMSSDPCRLRSEKLRIEPDTKKQLESNSKNFRNELDTKKVTGRDVKYAATGEDMSAI